MGTAVRDLGADRVVGVGVAPGAADGVRRVVGDAVASLAARIARRVSGSTRGSLAPQEYAPLGWKPAAAGAQTAGVSERGSVGRVGARDDFRAELATLIPRYFNARKAVHHYVSLARRIAAEH